MIHVNLLPPREQFPKQALGAACYRIRDTSWKADDVLAFSETLRDTELLTNN